MVSDFVVLEVEDEHAARLKKAIDEQFCVPANPLAGTTCLLIPGLKGRQFLCVPMLMKPAKIVKKMMSRGFKKSAKDGGFTISAVKISATRKKLGELKELYNELVKKELS